MRLSLFSSISVLLLAACGGASDDAPPDTPGPRDVATLPIDGYLLMADTLVLDPATGKTARASSDLVEVVAVAPDGLRFVARTAPMPDGPVGPNIITVYTSDLAEYRIDAGPTVTELRRIPKGNSAHYAPDGDWLASSNEVVDLTTGETYPCAGARFFPEGHWLCEGSETLMARGTLLATDVHIVAPDGEPARVPADGQLVNVATHSQSGASRAAPDAFTYDEEFEAAMPLPDGSFLSVHDGANGVIVTSLFANGVTTYQRTTVTAPSPDGYYYDFTEAFRDGTWSNPAQGGAEARQRKMVAALTPWFRDGEGRRFGPAAVTADGAVIWTVHSHEIVAGLHGILDEATREDAYVEVAVDGTTRGFRLTEVSELHLTGMSPRFAELTQPELAPYGVVDRPGGDWLRESSGLVTTNWLGYLDGAPVALMDAGRMSRDGRYLLRNRAPAQDNGGVAAVCVREVAKAAPEKCLPRSAAPVVELVGQGLTGSDSAPVIRNVSRVAAWPGSRVTIHGARFGTSGTLTVGGVAVATTTWSDHRIDFVMDAALPIVGDVVVTTAAGHSDAYRRFALHRTARLSTPFDAISIAPIELGQGQNLVAFGDLELGATNAGSLQINDQLRIDPDVRVDGHLVVTSSGATPATLFQTPIHSGPYTRTLEVQLADRLADADHWHLLFTEPDAEDLHPMFTDLGGQLVTESQGVLADTRIDVRSLPNQYRLPDYQRVDPIDGRVWVMSFVNFGTNGGASELTGWRDANDRWGYVQTAAGRGGGFNGAIGVASYGDVVILTGRDPITTRPHFRLSHDAGATWDITTTLDNLTGPFFAEPIAVAGPSPHFIVFEGGNGAQVTGVHRIDLDGTFTPDVLPAPSDLKTWYIDNHGDVRCFEVDSHDGTFIAFAPASGTLIAADDNGARTLPAPADATHIRAAFRAPDAFYAVSDDGTVWRATKASKWTDWTELDLAVDLHLPAKLDIRAVGIAGDHLFVRANMTNLDGSRHPYGDAGFFVAPL